ncbi:hypothetical protein PFISCL1PPCAC_21234, partial [Pristionchus fissidentatus]
QGFVEEDTINIECRVWIEKTIGVRKLRLVDFTKPCDSVNNVVLVVEGKKLNVSKDFLSVHSPVFSEMFYDKFDEEEREEIKLNDLKYEEFVDLLNVIFPTSIDIGANTVAHILKLADRFQIESVLDRSESYLIGSEKFDNLAKLKFADQHKLQLLMDHCLSYYTDFEQLKAIKPTAEYKGFSYKTKAAICGKILKM